MAKKVIVGGRIESKEVGGIVTGAAEILDDTKGKKQSVINQETGEELSRLDSAKQNVLTFDNTPTENSTNPVTSGGVYAAQYAIMLAIAAINELIPSAASAVNQLVDRALMNSSISTNTATFRGTSAAGLTEQQFLAWADGLTHDVNDYVFWQTVDAAGNTLFKRYKWDGTQWLYEYTLNNSSFTAEQWEAIQSGITALLVTKLRALPTAQELIQSFDGKQDVLTFDDTPTLGSNNPVKSSGIYNVIKAITDLVPAEATAQNQLADKADVAEKILAAIPSWKGQYDALTDLHAVTGAKAGDMGCVKTTDSDGHAVLTFYQYSAQGVWEVYYTLRHYAQNKPATTGTTGDYPYNGMGRIELQKNIVNGVNTLTQAMLTHQNTIYVIQYDFTLGENITVPANCVLEFDGGSLSGGYTITGANTGINAGLVKIFNTDITLAGSWNVRESFIEWFGGGVNSTASINSDAIDKAVTLLSQYGGTIKFNGHIEISRSLDLRSHNGICLEGTYTNLVNPAQTWNTIIIKNGNFDAVILGNWCSMRNIGVSSIAQSDTSDGIWVTGFGCILDNVGVNDQGGNGIKVGNKATGGDYLTDCCSFYSIKSVHNEGYGLYISDEQITNNDPHTADCNANNFYSLDIRDNTLGGIYVDKCIDNHFFGATVHVNGVRSTDPILADFYIGSKAEGHQLYSIYTESSNAQYGIYLAAGSTFNRVVGIRAGSNANGSSVFDANDANGWSATGYNYVEGRNINYRGAYIQSFVNFRRLSIVNPNYSTGPCAIELSDAGDLSIGSKSISIKNASAPTDAKFEQGTDGLVAPPWFSSLSIMGLGTSYGIRIKNDMINNIRNRAYAYTAQVDVGANSTVEQVVSLGVDNVKAGSFIIASPGDDALPSGISFYARCTADDTIKIYFVNSTAAQVTVPATRWNILALGSMILV